MTDSKTDTAPAGNSAPPRSGNVVATLAFVLSLVAVAAAAGIWYWLQFLQRDADMKTVVGLTEIAGKVELIGNEVNQVQRGQNDFASEEYVLRQVADGTRPLQEQQKILEGSINRLNSDIDRSLDAWVLEDIEQLLRLANNSLTLGNNVDNAVQALSLADKALLGLADPRFNSVREKIAAEITSLKTLELPDTAGIASRLSALARAVPNLALFNTPEKKPLAETESAESEEEGIWAGAKTMVKDVFGVQVQSVDAPPRPLLPPEQRYFLNQNLQLQLNSARLALLQAEPQIYQQSLEEAKVWVAEYFDIRDQNVKAFNAELAELAGQNLSVACLILALR